MSFDFGSFNNWGQLRTVAIRDVDTAFASDARIDAEWKDLNYHARPDLANARTEYRAVEEILSAAGAEIIKLPAGDGLTLDSIYTHDALIVTPRGLVKPRMGKPQRRRESEVNGAALAAMGFPIAGEITGGPRPFASGDRSAFLSALDRIETYDRGRPFGPWLMRIATNAAIDLLRSALDPRLRDAN